MLAPAGADEKNVHSRIASFRIRQRLDDWNGLAENVKLRDRRSVL